MTAYDDGNVRLLIIRLENSSDVWGSAVTEWYGEKRFSEPPEMVKSNETADSLVGALYKEVVSSIVFDPELVEEIYSTQYAKHFYSEDELAKFKRKWLDR